MGSRRIAGRLAAAIAFACVAAASSSAQEALVLWKTRAKNDGVVLIVRGAHPAEQVFLRFDVRPDPDSALAGEPNDARIADGAGIARFDYSRSDLGTDGRALFVQAFTVRPERANDPIRSNVVLLRDVPALYLLVDDADQRARVLRFDPFLRTLEARLTQLDGDSVLAVAGSVPFAARDGALVRDDPMATGAPEANRALRSGERPIDLVASADQSMLLALTREDLAQGRALIRLRLIETDASTREIASLEILRGGGRLVSAWLVSDSDSHRVLVAERQGVLREVVLGAEPGRGLTILPLSPLVSEELLDVAIHGDQLVVVTRPGPVLGRRAAASRMIVFDLDDRAEPSSTVLGGVAFDFEIAERPGGAAAFVALDSGVLEIVPLDGGGERPPAISIPCLRLLAHGPDGGIFALQADPSRPEATALRIDAASLVVDPLGLSGLSDRASHFGVFGDARRPWLFAVQPLGASGEEDELLCAELDPAGGSAVHSVTHSAIGGHVRRVASR